jgi:hypothetical protein
MLWRLAYLRKSPVVTTTQRLVENLRAALPRDHGELQRLYPATATELFSWRAGLLPDPIDLDRDGDFLLRHGITRDHLIDRLGGSP